jgi:acyl-CoA synthetase (AMP-forming)/AMP-acid ligase II
MGSLLQRLQRSVERNPQAEAVVHGTQRVGYAELWRQVCAVGGFLHARGLAPQARVAILLDNSVAYVAAYYGVLTAGGAVVALNTATKAVDLTGWLSHSGASWLIYDAGHAEAAALAAWCRGRIETVAVGGVPADGVTWDEVLQHEAIAAPPLSASEQLAAIIYTSGATGRPKGVMLSQRNLVANVDSILAYLGLGAADRIVNVLPFYYSYGNSVLHTHLAVGGCVVVEDNLVYPHRVMEHIAAERATGFAGVPSTYALLLSRVKFDDYDLSALRYMTQAGGPMPVANIERLMRALPRVKLFVMYGQTEATARLSYLPPEKLADKPGSIGVAIPGVTLEIRDEHGRETGVDQPGEIWARGDNIMGGYWGDPETTRQVLVDGWLKTGDMGRRDAEGYLYIEGRRSDMIKSGAHRIHPNEIEAAIAELDGVAEVAAVGTADEILGQVIKACVVLKPGAVLDVMQVKAHCRERLAAYKIPKTVEFMAALPKTASGKVRKFMLAENQINP